MCIERFGTVICMSGALKQDEAAQLQDLIDGLSSSHQVSAHVRTALEQLVNALQTSPDVVIFPADSFVTTTQAAEILGVSRMTVTRLVDGGELSSAGGGVHRRISVQELARYRSQRTERRRSALRSLAQDIDDETPPDDVVETR